MQKLVMIDGPEKEKFQAGKEGFNDPPPNLREITQKEYAERALMFCTVAQEFRQILRERLPEGVEAKYMVLPIHLSYIAQDEGYGISAEQGQLRFFQFGCAHHYEERDWKWAKAHGRVHFGNCYHICECTKCGVVKEYDSGD